MPGNFRVREGAFAMKSDGMPDIRRNIPAERRKIKRERRKRGESRKKSEKKEALAQNGASFLAETS